MLAEQTVVRLFFVSLFRMFHFTFALFLLTFSACVSKLREFSFFMIYRFSSWTLFYWFFFFLGACHWDSVDTRLLDCECSWRPDNWGRSSVEPASATDSPRSICFQSILREISPRFKRSCVLLPWWPEVVPKRQSWRQACGLSCHLCTPHSQLRFNGCF